MSRLHRSASRQMTDQAVSIQSRGSWTFGSPSVLMMFHRTPGQLSRELAEMDDCMPHYYKITGGHGMGAQRIDGGRGGPGPGAPQRRGHCSGAGRADIRAAARKIWLFAATFWKCGWPWPPGKPRRRTCAAAGSSCWAGTTPCGCTFFDSSSAWCLALLGQEESIPPCSGEHRLDTVNFLGPACP